MNCNKCGQKISDNFKFCSECRKIIVSKINSTAIINKKVIKRLNDKSLENNKISTDKLNDFKPNENVSEVSFCDNTQNTEIQLSSTSKVVRLDDTLQHSNVNNDNVIIDVNYINDNANGINLSNCISREYNGKSKNKKIIILIGTICIAGLIGSGGYMLLSKAKSNKEVSSVESNISDTNTKNTETSLDYSESNNENTTLNNLESIIERYSSRDYIIDNSNTVKLTFDSLNKYTSEELYIARNEILARHGYIFTNYPNLQRYFESKSWYSPNTDFSGELDEIEKYNEIYLTSMEFLKMAAKDKEVITSDYIFKDSNTRQLTEKEVSNLTNWQLVIAKNEIYARYGMEFSTAELHEHFSEKSWYKIDKENQNKFVLSDIENKNIDTILKEQDKRINSELSHDL